MREMSGRPQRVLVIDDDPALLALIRDSLQLVGGYEVMTASDGALGLEQFFATQPDCVVVDVRMPSLNGYQFIRALRGDPATAETPVVVLSALVQDRDALAGLLSGADAYLFKPVKIADLLRTVTQVLQVTSEERQQRSRKLSGSAEE